MTMPTMGKTTDENEQRLKHRNTMLNRIEALHAKTKLLEDKLQILRMKFPRLSAKVSAAYWHLKAAVKRESNTLTSSVDARGAIKRAERYCYDAGLAEDAAERLLYDVDAVQSDGDEEVRRHRKGLVLRIKKLMRKAARLASETKLTRRLRTLARTVEARKPAMSPASSDEVDIMSEVEDEKGSSIEESRNLSPIPEEMPQRHSDEGDDSDTSADEDDDMEEEREQFEAEDHNTQIPNKKKSKDTVIEEKLHMHQNDKHQKMPKTVWSPRFQQRIDGSNGSVRLTAHLPGVAEEDISIRVDREERKVIVEGTSKDRVFKKEVSVSDDFDLRRTEAVFEDDELHIVFAPRINRYKPCRNLRKGRHYDPFFSSMFESPFGRGGWGHPMMSAW